MHRHVVGNDRNIGLGVGGELATFSFNTKTANWLGESVFFATDLTDEQAFHSLPGVLGDFVIGNDDLLGELLPAGLSMGELEEHLSSRASVLGLSGTAEPQLVFIPEPSSLLLAMLSLALAPLTCRGHRRRAATCP